MIDSLTKEKRAECQEIVLDFQKYRAKKNPSLEVLRAVDKLLIDDEVLKRAELKSRAKPV